MSRLDKYLFNFQKIIQIKFGQSLKKREMELSLISHHRVPHSSGHFLLYTFTILTAFHQKRMACQPCRDIYGRRHASSRVLTARAGRMAIPTPSSNVIRRTNGPGYEGCRDPSSRKYGGSPVIGHDSLR